MPQAGRLDPGWVADVLLSANFRIHEASMQSHQILRHGPSALLLALLLAPSASVMAEQTAPEETAYLRAHPELRLCVDPDWMPYERLDADARVDRRRLARHLPGRWPPRRPARSP